MSGVGCRVSGMRISLVLLVSPSLSPSLSGIQTDGSIILQIDPGGRHPIGPYTPHPLRGVCHVSLSRWSTRLLDRLPRGRKRRRARLATLNFKGTVVKVNVVGAFRPESPYNVRSYGRKAYALLGQATPSATGCSFIQNWANYSDRASNKFSPLGLPKPVQASQPSPAW